MIVALEQKHLEAFEIMQQALNIAEEKLENATDKISLLEETHAAAVKKMEEELIATNKQLHNATVRIEVLESELSITRGLIVTLNATKASVVAVSELHREKASQAEFVVLSANQTLLAEVSTQAHKDIRQELNELSNSALNQTHHDQLEDFIAIFASTKANQSNFEILVSRVATLQNSTDELSQTLEYTTGELEVDIQGLFTVAHNATLAVASILDQVAVLKTTKVERAEFDSLSANLTSLRSTTSRIDQKLRYDIDDLAGGTINRTHHDELQDIVNMFAETKANLSDLKALEKRVSNLSRDINGSISD
ncbi:hypothetical protein GBAR_LOCUS18499 [Geodia barretti]|uniref:Uncharacterized protein n=1 Tax=Geodia barretti TaxID=519541 RepID=A0AA35SP89_GEOBA|nr:hypothetical protein GBAR_LOCUS18499 [Geodia barretti]